MKVSVVTPSYNQGNFIGRTLQSVQDQDFNSIEHVVFDGGSSDNTVEVLRQFGDRIRWVSSQDQGQADAVNKGIAATSGEIIGWLNSDDIFYQGAVRAAVEFLSAHPEFDVVYGMADYIGADDQPFDVYPTEPWNFERLQETCYICQPALFFRRSVVEQHGLLDVKLHYCMDYDYWLRLGAAGVRFAYLQKKLAGSRMYPGNKTRRATVGAHAEIIKVFHRRFGQVPDHWLRVHAHLATVARIDQSRRPMRFALEVNARTILGALKWNARLSNTMRKELRRQASQIVHGWRAKIVSPTSKN